MAKITVEFDSADLFEIQKMIVQRGESALRRKLQYAEMRLRGGSNLEKGKDFEDGFSDADKALRAQHHVRGQ